VRRSWLTTPEVLALHEEALAEFGGLGGIRDLGLLESALAKPKNLAASSRRSSIFDLAAAYCMGIAKNHPFVDGNKRMAFLVAAAFLDLNGYVVEPTEADVVQKMLQLAGGKLRQKRPSVWFRSCARRKRRIAD
jgi:death-on-curing protein